MIRPYPVFILLVMTAFVALLTPFPDAARAAAVQQTAKEAPDDPVIVRVQGQPITEKQVLDAIGQIAQSGQRTAEQLQKKDVAFFKDAVENLIRFALLRKEAQEKQMTVDKAKLDQAVQEIVRRFPSEAEFRKALAAQGVSEADMRKSLEDNLLFNQVLEVALKDLAGPSDEQVKKFYDDNPQYFAAPEQVHAAHILLKLAKESTPDQKAEARKKLEGIRADIESGKIQFAEAATKNSDDQVTAKSGGDLGFFPRGQMVKPFEEAAFSAKAGTLTPVVETQFGFHLIQVIESKPAGKVPLEESKDKIRAFLDRKSKQEAAGQYMEGLRKKATIETVMTEEEWVKRHGPR